MTEHTCGTCSMLATHLAALLIHDIAAAGNANPDRKAMLEALTQQDHNGTYLPTEPETGQ